ncbi:hypothetical protein PSU4_03970 [Pseudonocardia sulfidoxydans NBRC 16205]|uniref:DUF1990 domain-containing protein n=1 Tax=Pseudonocardia sulfidoxydans NBRC 16205 TaxID=1223511 RepID=A0A511DAP4_9PSEU|nr:DUF1990 family protein [Pseudonocardia sulfidoxydans]GEL21443.1 hypothetical protein PSU4_03970 [Pseudonocardia sulfidoxydans NBRC 16205]
MAVLSRKAATGTRRHRRVAALVRWPVGLAAVSWRYMWRTVPLHRSEVDGDASDEAPELPAHHRDDRVQEAADGHGDLLHRRYTVHIGGSGLDAEALVADLVRDINEWFPTGVAVFRRTRGEVGTIRDGDEFLIRLPGPWDGPVRVVGRDATGFRFATLRGHLEAGQIEFRARDVDGELVMGIESWARPGDVVSRVLYDKLLAAKEIQLNLWTEVLLRITRHAGGRPVGGVTVRTRRVAA